jgi:hypothetical protein
MPFRRSALPSSVGGQDVGKVTSADRGYSVGKALALGLRRPDYAKAGQEVTVATPEGSRRTSPSACDLRPGGHSGSHLGLARFSISLAMLRQVGTTLEFETPAAVCSRSRDLSSSGRPRSGMQNAL